MILFGQYDSPVTRRIGITLHHYGLPFARDTRSVFGDPAELARISPLVRIPALILDNGETLIDSTAILDHLDEIVGPDRALVPRLGPQRRAVLQLTAIAQGALEKAGAVVYERHFHPAPHRSPHWEARCLLQLNSGLTEIEHRLATPGPTLTHAEVMITCLWAYIQDRVPEATIPGFSRIAALAARCENLPSFQAARAAPDEVMPG